MPTPAKKSAMTPIPVQLSKTEFNQFILPHWTCSSFEAVLRDLKLATSSLEVTRATDDSDNDSVPTLLTSAQTQRQATLWTRTAARSISSAISSTRPQRRVSGRARQRTGKMTSLLKNIQTTARCKSRRWASHRSAWRPFRR